MDMARMDIRTLLSEGNILVFDGAMGTMYASLPGRAGLRCELANIDAPDEILGIHNAYLSAGSRAIKTNTFSVSVDVAEGNLVLAKKIIDAGCRLAQEAAAPYGAYVFGDIGPAPSGSGAELVDIYMAQARMFLDCGITHFLIETLSSDEGVEDFARRLKVISPDSFLLVSFAVGYDGFTREGGYGQSIFTKSSSIQGVDAVGFNCVSGPQHMLELVESLDIGSTPLSIMPNAGYPTVVGRRTVYQGSPDYFAEKMIRIVETGATIIGGCCGTTRDHIAQLVQLLEKSPPVVHRRRASAEPRTKSQGGRNPFWDKLEKGGRVIAVEFDPPAVDDSTAFLQGARALKDAGADIVTIADCPVGRPRADSSLLACKIKRDLGIEPLPHLTCRDRNLNATKALLLGLSMEGIHNVLLVTGDPLPSESRDEVKAVYNFNSRKLAHYVSELGRNTLINPFRIFGALNLNARNFDVQLKLAQEKETNGMLGFLTQPVLSPQAFENLKRARQVLNGKILGGVYPLVSHKNACFLNNEISGMSVSNEIISLYEGLNKKEAEQLGIDLSIKIAKDIEPYTDGTYLMTPFNRVSMAVTIIKQIK